MPQTFLSTLILPPTTPCSPAFRLGLLLPLLLSIGILSCNKKASPIKFTQVPPGMKGGPSTRGVISGSVDGLAPGQRIVLYAHNGSSWWVQPFANTPFTTVQADGTWTSPTHLGASYAAALVDGNYEPTTRSPSLPSIGGHVLAVNSVTPPPVAPQETTPTPKTIFFGGYEWEVRTDSNAAGGKSHQYVKDNAWVDADGAMHLRVSRNGDEWVCGAARTVRSLGYGTYLFGLRNVADLEPSATMSMFTWLEQAPGQTHREIDIHVSRWGNPRSPNAEFLIQPYYVPANVHRFEIPRGPVTTSLHWTPGRAVFAATNGDGKSIATWTFTAGIPTSGGEKLNVNLCEYGYALTPLKHDAEVVIDRFQFLP